MNGPDFLIIGAAKSGTTALYRALRAHPAIYMPDNKEPHFFAFPPGPLVLGGPRDHERHGRTITDPVAYEALFAARRPGQIAGEASTYSLYSPIAAPRIHEMLPGVRLIAILREPARRAFSNYLHLVRQGFETAPTFEEALAREPGRIADGWDFFWRYRDMGFYHRQLVRYVDRFPPERLLVLRHDDFQRDAARVIREVFGFLGVDPAVAPDVSRRANASGVPRSRRVQDLLAAPPRPVRWLARRLLSGGQRLRISESIGRLNLARAEASPATLAELRRGYRADVDALEQLTGLDLGAWREAGTVPGA